LEKRGGVGKRIVDVESSLKFFSGVNFFVYGRLGAIFQPLEWFFFFGKGVFPG
jgi:hypothetical protein